ncbi:GIY-YIG nuclease family protein [Mucilaginibacter sp. AK015]|uniref:GIY-YIG nuclease family protein n=1 Tax=Mucilaginibacter sp. AK015 TaxID=2723072 RepID=UPI00160C6447|nr:putative endonuclease [Mucilaginibacter sp. AK015]
MASVYILFSKELNRYYIGSCKDLPDRMKQHTNKDFVNSFTAKCNDWVFSLSIDNLEYQQARLIESYKRMKSKNYIENLKNYPEVIERLNLKYL